MIRYFLGEAVYVISRKDTRTVFDTLSRLDMQFTRMEKLENGFSFRIPLYRKKIFEEQLKREEITFEIRGITGLPSIIYRYRKRVGIPIGALIIILLIWLSGQVIWCVNVTGNSAVSDQEITELLARLGCGVGDRYENIDFDSLHNRFLIECDKIAWIAVNMNGTYANVEVRESSVFDDSREDGFYNIVATEDGQIERVASVEGKPVVEKGDTVKAGELLISGAISYKDTQNRFESAEGSVYATVKRSFEISIPAKQEIKAETGMETEKKVLTFFNFKINLFANSRNPYRFCDTITVNRQIYLFDSVKLPLQLQTITYREYTKESISLTEKEAEEMAMELYREKLYETLGSAQLLSKEIKTGFDGEAYTVRCDLYCLADIAQKVPLGLTESQNSENNEEETEDYGTDNGNDTQQ